MDIEYVTEPLFLDIENGRRRFPIGWRGLGRYQLGTLSVINAMGKIEEIEEEDNGIFFSFKSDDHGGLFHHENFTVSYKPREEDYKFAKGLGEFKDEEYFLFPNWLEADGENVAFWVAKYQVSRSDATSSSQGIENYPVSKPGKRVWTDVSYNNWKKIISSKGDKFHMIRNREWSNIALWCNKMNIYPTGNKFGYIDKTNIDGEGTNGMMLDYEYNGKTITGNGPITWNHNRLEDGISDIVGNVWEAVDGLLVISDKIYCYDKDNINYKNTHLKLKEDLYPNCKDSFSKMIYIDPKNDRILHECIPTSNSNLPHIDVKGNDLVQYDATKVRVLYRGGCCYYGEQSGLFTFYTEIDPNSSYWAASTRIVKEI